VEDFSHWGAGDVGALLREAAVGEVASGVLAVGHVDVGDDVDDSAVGFLWEAFVLAAVAGFHVEDRDVEALGSDHAEAGVGVAEDEDCVGPGGDEELVGAVDDVADGGAEVIADGVHVDLGSLELEVTEEDAVEIVVVVLTGVGEDYVEVLAALVDHSREADDLRACAHYDAELELAVVLEADVAVIELWSFLFHISFVFFFFVFILSLSLCCLFVVLFDWVEVGVWFIGVEDLVAVHDCDEVLGVGEVDDVVGIAGEHDDGLDPVAIDFIVEDDWVAVFVELVFCRVFRAELDEAVAADDYELLPLGVVPVLALGDAWFADVDADLAGARGVEELGEGAALVGVHLEVEDGLVLREVAEVGCVELLLEGVVWHVGDQEGRGLGGAGVDRVNDRAEGSPVGDRAEAVTACWGWDSVDAVELAAVLVALEGLDHLVDEVVDVEELHLDAAVIDLDREAVGYVVAEGGDGGVVVRAAPLAEEVREAVDEDLGSGFFAVLEHEFFSGFLALAVFGGAEAAGEGGLDGAADHHRAAVAVFLEGVQQSGGEAEVAFHELLRVLRAVDSREVEDEGAVLAPGVELLRG